jgi:hypothetical protein
MDPTPHRLSFWWRLRPVALTIIAAGAVLASCSAATAQPQAGKANPDQFLLGTVTVDSIVEASVRLFSAEADNRGFAIKVDPPPFVAVRDVTLGTQQFGQYGTWSVCDISFALHTAVAKEYSGNLKVQLGKQRDSTEIRITAAVVPPKAGQPRVLVVETPFQKFSTSDGRLFESWIQLVKAAELDVSSIVVSRGKPILRDIDVTRFDTVLLSGDGLCYMQDGDAATLKRFVENGGRLVIAANYFCRGTVTKANELLSAAGMTMHDTETMGEAFVVEAENIIVGRYTTGVRKVKLHRASQISSINKDVELIVNDPAAPAQGFVAAGRLEKGHVIAVGQSLWWSWIASYPDSDNARLLQNLLVRRRND